jgi:hypothetical protein
VVTRVSQATFELGSKAKKWSINASEIWSATLSGCPSETDSEVNKYPICKIIFFKVKAAKIAYFMNYKYSFTYFFKNKLFIKNDKE